MHQGIHQCRQETLFLQRITGGILQEGIQIGCAGIEEGVTGQREAIVFELERRKNNVRFEDDSIVGWNKDPYDENIKTGFLMNLAEQAEYDSMFPSHPLSQLRELVRFIVEKN